MLSRTCFTSLRTTAGAFLLAFFALAPALRAEDAPVIAAAADLQFALKDIAAAFTQETGMAVTLAFGSTGNFATQIREGAPFQMFMAADETVVAALAAENLTRDEGQLYALGRLVMIAPEGSPLAADGQLGSVRAALAAGTLRHFAIANPEHAPYGQRAKQALQHAGLWEDIQPSLVLGENAAQAAQFATSGNAQGGIIAYALALSEQVSSGASYELIPADWHSPLNQRMVLLKGAGPVATAFYDFVTSPGARDIMVKYGFALPEE